jgi:hypothetical protein
VAPVTISMPAARISFSRCAGSIASNERSRPSNRTNTVTSLPSASSTPPSRRVRCAHSPYVVR